MILGKGFDLVGSREDSFSFVPCSGLVVRVLRMVAVLKRKGMKMDIPVDGVDQIVAVGEL